jgi:hypothetical protein
MVEDETLLAAILFLFFVGHATRIFERNYDEMLMSIEEELERQAMDSSEVFVKDVASLQLQGLPCIEEDEYRASEGGGTEVAAKRRMCLNV